MRSTRRLAALVSAVALSCFRPPETTRRDQARDPAGARAPALPARTYRVRLLAGSGCRAWGPDLEDRARRLLALASGVTAPSFGVTFQLVDVSPVESRSLAEAPPPTLDELVILAWMLDPGDDVDLVLGCAEPPVPATTVQDQLGCALPLGRHLVLRTLESEEEGTAAFLHAWGQMLGAPHSSDGLMSGSHSKEHPSFSPESVAVISIGLRQKPPGLQDPAVRAAWSKEMSAWLESEAGKALSPRARAYLTALVAAVGADKLRW